MRDAWLLLAWLLFLLELQPVVAKTSPVAAKNSTYTQEEWIYKTTDCTGPYSTSTQDEAAQAAKGCVNDALMHSRKVTCTDN